MNANSNKRNQSLLDRMSNALVYVLALPFIAIFIAMKRVFVEQKHPSKSYANRIPEGKKIG